MRAHELIGEFRCFELLAMGVAGIFPDDPCDTGRAPWRWRTLIDWHR